MTSDQYLVVIADDHPIFRDGLSSVIKQQLPGAQTMHAGDMAAVRLALAAEQVPDLLVLDLYFPGFSVNPDLGELRQPLPLTAIVVVSMTEDEAVISSILESGINGFISKSVAPELMADGFRRVMEGEMVVHRPSQVHPSAPEHSDAARLSELSPRQAEVLRLVCQGLSNKEIAQVLALSPFTVRVHVSAMMKVLGVGSRSAAAAIGAAHGFTLPPPA